MTLIRLFTLVVASCLAADALAAHRTFVASYGSDGNAATFSCSLGAPCRTFATAITQVDPGGEIVALDAAGYGPVAIDKSVTIRANPGYYAGISNSVGSAISVNGPAHVVLKGLNLNGASGIGSGIFFSPSGSLTIENCVIADFSSAGIVVTGGVDVRIVDTVVRGNGLSPGGIQDGIYLSGEIAATLHNVKISGNGRAGIHAEWGSMVNVMNSESSGNEFGFIVFKNGAYDPRLSITDSLVANNATGIWNSNVGSYTAVSRSAIVGNGVGLRNNGGGTLETYGDNVLRYNTTPIEGTITPVSGL